MSDYLYHELPLSNGNTAKFIHANGLLYCYGRNVSSVLGDGTTRYSEIPDEHKSTYSISEAYSGESVWLTFEGSILQFQGREACLNSPEKSAVFLEYLSELFRLKLEGLGSEGNSRRERIEDCIRFVVNTVNDAPEGIHFDFLIQSVTDQILASQ